MKRAAPVETPDELRKILNTIPYQSRLNKDIRGYFSRHYGIVFSVSRDRDSVLTTHRYRVGFHYWEKEYPTVGIDSTSAGQPSVRSCPIAFYSRGEFGVNIQPKQEKAFRVRLIVPEDADTPLFFKDILWMMNEEFSPTGVRSARVLVFKYLEELMKRNDSGKVGEGD